MTTLYVNPTSTKWSTMTLGTAAGGPYTLGPGDVAAETIVDLNGASDPSLNGGSFDIDQTGGVTCAAIIDSTRTGLDIASITVHASKNIHGNVGNNTADGGLTGAKIMMWGGDASGAFALYGNFLSGLFEMSALTFVGGSMSVTFHGSIHGSIYWNTNDTVKWTGTIVQPANCYAAIISGVEYGFINIASLVLSNYGIVSMSTFAGHDMNPGTGGTRAVVTNMSANAQFAFASRPHDTESYTPIFNAWALPADQVIDGVNRYDGTGASSGAGTLGTYPTTAATQAADAAAITPATVLYGTTITFGASSVNGTYYAPANADVRHGTANGVSPGAGTAYIPAASNVRYGTSVDATTGTCHVPTAAQTLYGVSVDVSDTGTVTLPNTDGSTPDASLVKSTAHFGAGNATAGTLDTASIATEAASAQHTIDAEFLTTHADEIISADTFILSEFGIAGTAAAEGGGLTTEEHDVLMALPSVSAIVTAMSDMAGTGTGNTLAAAVNRLAQRYPQK